MDLSVHDFLLRLESRSIDRYALITCLDSSANVSSIRDQNPSLREIWKRCQAVGNGILMTTHQLLSVETKVRMFYGFDEVWFCGNNVIAPKPEGLVLVGPSVITEAELVQHRDWLATSKCGLGVGGGVGLNFCVRAAGAARHIIAAFADTTEEINTL